MAFTGRMVRKGECYGIACLAQWVTILHQGEPACNHNRRGATVPCDCTMTGRCSHDDQRSDRTRQTVVRNERAQRGQPERHWQPLSVKDTPSEIVLWTDGTLQECWR